MLVLDDSPRNPPAGFASPVAAPLSAPPAARPADPLDSLPRPDSLTVQAGPALDSLAAGSLAGRDPHEPFDAVQQLISETSGPRDPRTPFRVNSSADVWSAAIEGPAPDQSQIVHAAPPSGSPYPAQPERIGIGRALREAGWPMLVALGIGVLIGPLSLLGLLAAWMLSMLRPATASALRRVFSWAIGLEAFLVFVALVSQYFDPLTLAGEWARWVCLALLVACPWVMHRRLTRQAGETAAAAQARQAAAQARTDDPNNAGRARR